MEIIRDVVVKEEYIGNLPGEYDGTTNDLRWQIVKCPACNNILLREGWGMKPDRIIQ